MKEGINMTIGDRIRNRRKELHLTQEDLGNKMGVTKSAICKVEKDKEQNLTLDRVEEFANALECSTSYLMGWEKPQEIPSIPDGAIEVIDLYARITPEQREAVLNLLRSFIVSNQE